MCLAILKFFEHVTCEDSRVCFLERIAALQGSGEIFERGVTVAFQERLHLDPVRQIHQFVVGFG